jgi:hypothetical protein
MLQLRFCKFWLGKHCLTLTKVFGTIFPKKFGIFLHIISKYESKLFSQFCFMYCVYRTHFATKVTKLLKSLRVVTNLFEDPVV